MTKSLYEKALSVLPEKDIDSYESTMYLRKTPESEKLVNEYEFKENVTKFRDNIDHEIWYDIPFSYVPFFDKKRQSHDDIMLYKKNIIPYKKRNEEI